MIKVENLTIGYKKSEPIISNYSVNLNDNNIYAILGDSGIGKTTLLRTISGLLKPISGIVQNTTDNTVFMMHQRYTNFNWLSCLDNVLLPRKISNKKISEKDIEEAKSLLNDVGLGKYEKSFPSELSGGQNQRLALSRTLFVRPKILLMDEPLSALDEKTRESMQDLILEQHTELKNLILLVTHSKEEAEKMSDQIIYLK